MIKNNFFNNVLPVDVKDFVTSIVDKDLTKK